MAHHALLAHVLSTSSFGALLSFRLFKSVKIRMSETAAGHVATIVEEARLLIETCAIPPNPRDPSSNNRVLAWRLRPSELRAIAVQDFLQPPPAWGLRINLANLRIGPDHAITIARSLILNHTVTSIDLSMCDVGTSACCELFRCLERNKTLRHLNLNGNFIAPAGAVAAAVCVGKLETLHMACNQIGTKGCLALASALASSTTMKFLNVRGNGISLYGVYSLIEALDSNIVMRLSDDVKQAVADSRREYLSELAAERTAVQTTNITNTIQKMMSAIRTAAAVSHLLPHSPSQRGGQHRSAENDSASQSSSPNGREKRSASTAGTPLMGTRKSLNADQSNDLASMASSSYQTGDGALPATPLTADPSKPANTSCHSLWVQGNCDAPPELLDVLVQILTKRVPQPPEGLNTKKKKKGKK